MGAIRERPFVSKKNGMIDILGDYSGFIDNINRGLHELGIERDELAMMDHVCY